MIIEIATEGGFGGISAAASRKRIEADRQPQDLRDALCAAFAPKTLTELSQTSCAACPDGLSYRITVIEAGHAPQIFILAERQIPDEMLDLIDRL
nr:protealysin inhibitor emfourin [Paracoccus saliphilus]